MPIKLLFIIVESVALSTSVRSGFWGWLLQFGKFLGLVLQTVVVTHVTVGKEHFGAALSTAFDGFDREMGFHVAF